MKPFLFTFFFLISQNLFADNYSLPELRNEVKGFGHPYEYCSIVIDRLIEHSYDAWLNCKGEYDFEKWTCVYRVKTSTTSINFEELHKECF